LILKFYPQEKSKKYNYGCINITKEKIKKIRAKIDKAIKSGLAKKQTKAELLLEFKTRINIK